MEENERTLQVIYGDGVLGLRGEDFHYIFSYKTGGPESFVIHGREWLYRTPRPTFWRAVTDNDRGSGFPLASGMWLGADLFIKCVSMDMAVDKRNVEFPWAPANNCFCGRETAGCVKISYTYETITVPAASVVVSYEVSARGQILVKVCYFGKKGLPGLPVFGLRLIAPMKAMGYRYRGLSGETYPDRMAGAIKGVFEVEGLPVTKYLVPQDCGVHMDTRWLEVYDSTASGIRFGADDAPFAFSCLPYTAEELENATHHEELPPARRTVICIFGAVRGVGGIDSWGSDVEPAYRIHGEREIRFSFVIDAARDLWKS